PQNQSRPRGLKWRSSVWFVTLDDQSLGVMTDLLIYSVIIPVLPFQLEKLGYSSVSALTAWLLFSYSVGLVIFSPILSWFSERYYVRSSPLLWGLLGIMGFLVMFMEAPNYAVMVAARFLQGIGSSVIWVIGLALLGDTVPPERLGQQLGLAMSGFTVGILAAPPIGGALYDRFGFRAPFIFGIIFATLDFLGRILVIERKDALKWGHDPAFPGNTGTPATTGIPSTERKAEANLNEAREASEAGGQESHGGLPSVINDARSQKKSELEVWKFMLTSSRTLVALFSVFIYGIVYSGLEPTLALRMQDLYGLDSAKVGIVMLASAIAAIFSSPISGWMSDRFGVEWITGSCLALTIPWYALMIVRGHLAFFIVCFALSNFMMGALVSPLISELASIVRKVDGIGFAHIYGFFNLAFGVGSAVGPITAGLVYSHVQQGWAIMLSYGSGLLFLCCVVSIFYAGERPLASRLMRCGVASASAPEV
ncbi:MFS general substrate transporter, partial [Phellopilus nigrolimitatus]